MSINTTDEQFDQFVSRAASLVDTEFNQAPAAVLKVVREKNTLQGLVDFADGTRVWWDFEVSADQLSSRGPDALAYKFISDLRTAREEYKRFK